MPYHGEFAGYKSIRRIAHNKRVIEQLGRFAIVQRESIGSIAAFTAETDISTSPNPPSWVLAIDGSHLEYLVENGFPQAEVSSVTVSSVLIDLKKVQELDQARPVDPLQFRQTEKAASVDGCLPGSNVIWQGEATPHSSFRRTLFDILEQERLATDSETLLETYEALLIHKPDSRDQRCPVDSCPDDHVFSRGTGDYFCHCVRRDRLYSTDALRIHEGMATEGSNGAMFGEVMQVWESIWMIHILRYFEKRGWLDRIPKIAIFVDGPLAVFGHPAWLSKSICAELVRINNLIQHETKGEQLLLVGVEKTGRFVDHFEHLDRTSGGGYGSIAAGSVLLMTDDYIKRNINFSKSDKPYGADTYYGRKLFYKTRSGARLVVSVPFLDALHADTSTADPDQFPRLGDVLVLLNQLISSRFPNALAPLVSAHAEAAIPLNLGGRVLERLALELISKNN